MASIQSRIADAFPAGWTSERVAAATFGVYLAVALPILLTLGSHYWLMGDEWAFLTGGELTDPAVLFRSIQSHWSTLPILVYRALYTVFGLHSYLPFQLCLIVLHLTLCYLLRAIMRRAGVGPWIATICAATFVLFGPGETNILAGVQISQVGSLVCGLTHLILADHDGRIDRRDWLGLLCGLLGIMSSGFGPPLVAIVGLAVLLRRGWRAALFHTLPLAAVYMLWWLSNKTGSSAELNLPPLLILVRWVMYGQSGVFLAIGAYDVIAIALGVLLVAGLILAWAPLSRPLLRQQASLPAAMLLGALGLLAVICLERWFMIWITGFDAARSDRYMSACTVLTLPALAVAADAVVRRWHWMMPGVCALFLIGITANTMRFGSIVYRTPDANNATRAALLAAAYSPLAEQAPADLMPDPHGVLGGDVDMAFLIAARDSGRLPPPPIMTAALASQTELRLSVQQIHGPIPGTRSSTVYNKPIELKPEVGEQFEFTTPLLLSLGESGKPLAFNAGWGALPAIRILRPDLQFHVSAKPPATNFGLCKARGVEKKSPGGPRDAQSR